MRKSGIRECWLDWNESTDLSDFVNEDGWQSFEEYYEHGEKSEDEWNGLLGWWTLHDEVKGIGGQRTLSLTQKVLKPEKATDLKELIENIDAWEADITLYTNISPDNKVRDDSQMCIVRDICTAEMDKLVMNQSNHSLDYKKY